MRASDWLARCVPARPATLGRRIDELAAGEDQRADVAEQCVSAACRALPALLARDATARADALDLLAIDALVTYAFEAAADTPDRIPDLSAAAVTSLSRIAAAPTA